MWKVSMFQVQELVRLHRMGVSCHEVARLLGVSPNTERPYRVARRSSSSRCMRAASPRPSSRKDSGRASRNASTPARAPVAPWALARRGAAGAGAESIIHRP